MDPSSKALLQKHAEAQKHFAEGEYTEALAAYRYVESHIQDDEVNLPVVRIELGWTHYMMHDYPRCVACLEYALTSPHLDGNQRFDCLRLIGMSLIAQGQGDDGVARLNEALGMPVSDALKRHTHFELGKFFFSEQKYREARNYLANSLAQFGPDEQGYRQTVKYYLGFCEFFAGSNSRAGEFFRELIAEAPDRRSQAPGYFGQAHLFYENREYPALVDACEKIIRLDPDFYDRETLPYFLCHGYMHLQMWDQLESFLPNLTEQFPRGRYHSAYNTLEKAASERSRPDESTQ